MTLSIILCALAIGVVVMLVNFIADDASGWED
jgi:hypothetical protein